MRFRLKIVAGVFALGAIATAMWQGFVRHEVASPVDCNIQAPLPGCAGEPQFDIRAHDVAMANFGPAPPALASAPANDGTLASIRFVPTAAAADITEFLVANSITLVDGPKSGGMYTVRLPETGKKKNELIKRIAIETAIVDFIATVQ
jgi:hypothetical protein